MTIAINSQLNSIDLDTLCREMASLCGPENSDEVKDSARVSGGRQNLVLTSKEGLSLMRTLGSPDLDGQSDSFLSADEHVKVAQTLNKLVEDLNTDLAVLGKNNSNRPAAPKGYSGSVINDFAFSITDLMVLINDCAKHLRKAGWEMRKSALNNELAAIDARANYIKDSGKYAMIMGICFGVAQLGMTAFGTYKSISSTGQQLKMLKSDTGISSSAVDMNMTNKAMSPELARQQLASIEEKLPALEVPPPEQPVVENADMNNQGGILKDNNELMPVEIKEEAPKVPVGDKHEVAQNVPAQNNVDNQKEVPDAPAQNNVNKQEEEPKAPAEDNVNKQEVAQKAPAENNVKKLEEEPKAPAGSNGNKKAGPSSLQDKVQSYFKDAIAKKDAFEAASNKLNNPQRNIDNNAPGNKDVVPSQEKVEEAGLEAREAYDKAMEDYDNAVADQQARVERLEGLPESEQGDNHAQELAEARIELKNLVNGREYAKAFQLDGKAQVSTPAQLKGDRFVAEQNFRARQDYVEKDVDFRELSNSTTFGNAVTASSAPVGGILNTIIQMYTSTKQHDAIKKEEDEKKWAFEQQTGNDIYEAAKDVASQVINVIAKIIDADSRVNQQIISG